MTEAEIKNKAVKEYYRRAAQRELARRYFWEYCKLISPDFYKEERAYLKRLCETLDKFYKQELINPKTGSPYKKLMMNLPPQHGKSLTRWTNSKVRKNHEPFRGGENKYQKKEEKGRSFV